MKSSRHLWYHLEQFFDEVHRECERVLAGSMVHRERAALATVLEGGRQRTIETMPGEERYPGAVALSKEAWFADSNPNGVDLVAVRKKVRAGLMTLRTELGQVFTQREVYHVLFPVTIHADELFLGVSGDRAHTWELLQSELYEIDNGGEYYFNVLDRLLMEDETHPFVFQVFYFCLSDGFGGRYRDNPSRLEDYKMRLMSRIAVETPSASAALLLPPAPVDLIGFPWYYYAAAVGTVVVLFFALGFFGQIATAAP